MNIFFEYIILLQSRSSSLTLPDAPDISPIESRNSPFLTHKS